VIGSKDVTQHESHFLRRQHDRQSFPAPRPHGIKPAEIDLQHLTVEEQQRVERLILGTCRDVFLDRQMGQELLDLRRSHRARMPLLVEQDVA
jgi:hypothetical protein